MASTFSGKWEFVEGNMFRNAKGQFNSFVGEFQSANGRLARELQRSVMGELTAGMVRPRDARTGVLEQVTASPRNRDSDVTGYGVGMINYLDDSTAKYWLQIEKGSDIHLGQVLVGLWEDKRGGGGPYSPFGVSNQQAFVPMRRSKARRILRSQGFPDIGTRGVIERPIPKERYYIKGWDAFGALERTEQVYSDIFASAGYKVKWVNGKLRITPGRA